MKYNFSFFFFLILRLAAAAIMLQTLYFKFTGHPQSVYIFSQLGMEPWGRIGIGAGELIASALLLFPRTIGIGAALGAGLMAGAIFFHLTRLGIEVDGDSGLFTLGLIVFVCCLILLWHYRSQVPVLNKIIQQKKTV